MVYVSQYFEGQSYYGKLNLVLLNYISCLSSSIKLGQVINKKTGFSPGVLEQSDGQVAINSHSAVW